MFLIFSIFLCFCFLPSLVITLLLTFEILRSYLSGVSLPSFSSCCMFLSFHLIFHPLPLLSIFLPLPSLWKVLLPVSFSRSFDRALLSNPLLLSLLFHRFLHFIFHLRTFFLWYFSSVFSFCYCTVTRLIRCIQISQFSFPSLLSMMLPSFSLLLLA